MKIHAAYAKRKASSGGPRVAGPPGSARGLDVATRDVSKEFFPCTVTARACAHTHRQRGKYTHPADSVWHLRVRICGYLPKTLSVLRYSTHYADLATTLRRASHNPGNDNSSR